MPRMIVEPIVTEKLCSYGCGKIARFIAIKSNKFVCSESPNKCEINRIKNSKGILKTYSLGIRKPHKQVYLDLPEDTKIRMNWNKENYKADFSFDGKGSHKKVLIKERGHICESCNLSEWLCEPIPLELEHKDGNNRNNIKENLSLLCPNCHAKTKFYRGRNINTGKLKVTDEEILKELKKGLTNRQVLINVGLTPKGGNYNRVNNLRYNMLP